MSGMSNDTKMYLEALFGPDDKVAVNGPSPAVQVYFGPVCAASTAEYITVNSVADKRAASNVTYFRNFLLEFDSISLPHQQELLAILGKLIPIRTITYSGNKSMHAIISLSDQLIRPNGGVESADLYSTYAKQLMRAALAALTPHVKEAYTGNLIDPATSDAARLTRMAGAVNRKTDRTQMLHHVGELCSSEQFTNFTSQYAPAVTTYKTEFTSQVYVGSFEHTLDCQTSLRHLRRKLRVPEEWGGAAGNHHLVFNYACWAIDATGVPQKELTEYVLKYTAPYLLTLGYPAYKLEDAIAGAYRYKGVKNV